MITFDSTKIQLKQVLGEITVGKIQLPISSVARYGTTSTLSHCLPALRAPLRPAIGARASALAGHGLKAT